MTVTVAELMGAGTCAPRGHSWLTCGWNCSTQLSKSLETILNACGIVSVLAFLVWNCMRTESRARILLLCICDASKYLGHGLLQGVCMGA